MNQVTKLIVMSVLISLTAVVASIIIYVARVGEISLDGYFTRLSSVLSSTAEPDFAKYSGQYVDGKTVRSTIESDGGNYFFRIKTKTNSASFCVYEKPIDHLLNDGSGGYHNYTKSSSLYYINEGSLYMTTVYRNDDNGDVIGALFEEKGAGSISGTLSNIYQLTDLIAIQNRYLRDLADQNSRMDENSLLQATESAENAIEELNSKANQLLADGADVSIGSDKMENFTKSQEDLDAAVDAVEQAWKDYEDAFESVTGKKSDGHSDITSYKAFNDASDLQYWIDLFSGNISAGD